MKKKTRQFLAYVASNIFLFAFCVFIILKLFKVVDWSWWIICSPFIALVMYYIIYWLILVFHYKKKNKKEVEKAQVIPLSRSERRRAERQKMKLNKRRR